MKCWNETFIICENPTKCWFSANTSKKWFLGTRIIFTFNNKFYIQVDGVAMGALLGPILANIFLSPHEENWLNKCPIEFKPVFIEGMLMIFLYFLNHLNLPNRVASICPLNTRTWTSPLNRKILPHFRFWTSKFVVKTLNLSPVFIENQHLVVFSQIMKVLFQRTKRKEFYTHYFIDSLAYVGISTHFILKLIIWRLSLWKATTPWIS